MLTHWKEREPVYAAGARGSPPRTAASCRPTRRAGARPSRSTGAAKKAERDRAPDHARRCPTAISKAEFAELVRDLHRAEPAAGGAEPAQRGPPRRARRAAQRPKPKPEPPTPPTDRGDALPEDVVMPGAPEPPQAARRLEVAQRDRAREAALMGLLAWVIMGLALWHFTIFLPDRFWGGIVGAFLGAIVGAIVAGL